MQFFKNLLGMEPSANYAALLAAGATIVDVRTPAEFTSGHVPGSVNIPLDRLPRELTKLQQQNAVIITCCASGMRSGTAAEMLKRAGCQAFNAGGWHKLLPYVNTDKP